MLVLILGSDTPNSLPRRQAARAAHLQRLTDLQSAGRLRIAGPLPIDPDDAAKGYAGSAIVAEFDSLEDAQRWADADPYVDAGVYSSVHVQPFVQVFPND